MRKIYSIAATLAMALMTINTSYAQIDFGGTAINNDIVGWGDLYEMSFTSRNYGTARSMAMGNAFTALGADMVSASMNPAGIGMYVSSDASISPIMQFTKSPTSGADKFGNFKDHSERFGLSSAGAVFTAYKGSGTVTNVNVGFAYNRLADFNQNTSLASYGYDANNSLANFFCTLANADENMPTPIAEGKDAGSLSFGYDPFYWGPVLAYKNGLINNDDQGWFVDRIGENATVDQFSAVETRGSLGEYALTAGMNIKDFIYIGATLGIESLNYMREVYYGENYSYAPGTEPAGDVMPYQLEYMNYSQRTRLTGTGINFKIGVTARPVEWLRIGVAYHTPTLYTMTLRYGGEMWNGTKSVGSNPENYDINKNGYVRDIPVATPIWEDAGNYTWEYRTPSRLLTGVAVTLAKRVILSADYERSWYQSIRLQSSPIYGLSYTDTMKECFKGSNTVRLGAEGYVLPFLSLRAGYIWSGSTLRDEYKDAVFTHPLPTEQWYATAGVGLKFNEYIYLDVAYQYGTTKYSQYQTFYAVDSEYPDPEYDIQSNLFTTKTNRHIAVVTLGVRF